MNINIKRRTFIRIVTFTLALIAALAMYGGITRARAKDFEAQLSYGYQRALTGLFDSVTGINNAFSKMNLASSPVMLVSLSGEISRQSYLAENYLSELPIFEERMEEASKFISQAGDYSISIGKRAASGESMTDEDRKILESLYKYSSNLSSDLNGIITMQNSGMLVKNAASKIGGEFSGIFSSMKQNVKDYPEYPSLIYDGPFSDHLEKAEPVFLKNKPKLSEQQAKKKAAAFLGVSEEEIKSSGTVNGKIKAYSFSCKKSNGECGIDISVYGGYPIDFTDSREIDEAKVDIKKAIEAAQKLLEKFGAKNMTNSYYYIQGGKAVINFEYMQGDVIIYPDLIEVGIALDNGKPVSFLSKGYLMCHKERELPKPEISKEEAEKKITGGIKPDMHRLAIIPTAGENEVFCHEFKCTGKDGREYLVFINAKTGNEEKILILLNDDNGTLTV